MDNIIADITKRMPTLQEEELEDLIPALMDHFVGHIHSLSTYVYGSERGVALGAFKEFASQTLYRGLHAFIIKQELWRAGRPLEPYLIKCLKKLSETLKTDIDFVKHVSVPICPACKTLNEREFLNYEGKQLRCPSCTKDSERLGAIKNRSSHDEYIYRLRKIFSLHSRKGFRCPECHRFLPLSYLGEDSSRVSCLYDNCTWFGIASELEPMVHPLGQNSVNISANTNISNSRKVLSVKNETGVELMDMFKSNAPAQDIRIECDETYKHEFDIVQSVIKTQKERQNKKNLKKLLMYQAFEDMFKDDAEGMITYLTRGRASGERPIQSAIFQRYVQLLENRLPFEVKDENGELKEIYSLLDPALDLFLGTSEFQTFVRSGNGNIIQNKTHEIYTGAKCNGPCFIGLLCDITDVETGQSLLDKVDYYTFAYIRMKPEVKVGTMVKVVHFRIPPHYEMFSLVLLQRTRRKIVDSINRRLASTKPTPIKS